MANDLSALIRSGTLGPGARVPSVRRMSRQRRVSIATVLQAYRLLENRGLIEVRPQSGYYVRVPLRPVAEPAISKPPRSPQLVGVHALVNRVLEPLPKLPPRELRHSMVGPHRTRDCAHWGTRARSRPAIVIEGRSHPRGPCADRRIERLQRPACSAFFTRSRAASTAASRLFCRVQ